MYNIDDIKQGLKQPLEDTDVRSQIVAECQTELHYNVFKEIKVII